MRQAAAGGYEVGRLTDSFHLNLTAFGLLSFAVGIFIVHGAIGLAFEQRRGMVRTMRAVGMPLRRLVVLFALELALLALAGGAIGILLGYLVAASLLPDVAATLDGLYGAQVAGTLQLRPVWWLSGLAMALAGTALAATDALWRIARMPILSSGGARAWSMARRPVAARYRRWPRRCCLRRPACWLLSAAGWSPGFALLACLLVGAALALPLILDLALGAAQRTARGVVWEWFWADTRQQLPGLSLALMALLLAMAANVGVSTMVSSFRLTFTGFLDQRLASELYVTADTADQARAAGGVRARREAARCCRSCRSTPGSPACRRSCSARGWGRPIPRTGGSSPSDPDAWAQVAAGTAVIVNEQLARRADLWVGDQLTVGPETAAADCRGLRRLRQPHRQAIIGEALFRQLFPERARNALRHPQRRPRSAGRRPHRGVRPAAAQHHRPGALKAVFAADVRPDLPRDRRAQCADPRGRGFRDPDQPADPRGDAPAAAGAGLGAGADPGASWAGWNCCARSCWPR